MMLADMMHSRENRIDQIRLGAALAVFVGHSWHIALGPQAIVPLENFIGIGFHKLAVFVFFFLSGMLISESARRNQERMDRFAWARFRRLFPALCVNALCIPLLLIATGAWTAPTFGAVAEHAVRLVTLMSVEFSRPDVFAGLPFEHAINGSVWSLRHEIFVYGIIGLGAVVGTYLRPLRYVGVMLLFSAWTIAGLFLADVEAASSGIAFVLVEGRYLAFACLLGVLAHRYASVLPVDGHVAVGVALGLLVPTIAAQLFLPDWVYTLCLIVLICQLTLLVAYAGSWKKTGLKGDISYGVYIYAWPLQQLTVMAFQSVFGLPPSPWVLAAIALPPVVLAGYLSWILVEKPALKWKMPGWMPVGFLVRPRVADEVR